MVIHFMKKIIILSLVCLVFTGIFSFGAVLAVPPQSPYAPGETTDPACAPGSVNCAVVSPVPYSGATSSVNLGQHNLTVNGVSKIGYDGLNYATLTTDKNGNLIITTKSSSNGGAVAVNSASGGDASVVSNQGTLVLGANGGTNNENLKFDFETYKDKVAVTSDTGVNTLDFSSLNLATTGSLTLGNSTPGTLVTRIKNGAPTESDNNGALVVDATNGRLYIRYNDGWHYIAQTAGFQIPNYETKDPISGDQMKEGDLVIGKIDEKVKDGALHGIWTKATNLFSQVGIIVKDGVVSLKNLVAEKITTKVARISRLEMVDKATGNTYCMWIENDSWKKEKGECK